MSIAQEKQERKAAGGITLYDGGVYLVDDQEIGPEAEAAKVKALTGKEAVKEEARKGTITPRARPKI